jgi:hypothetical protein
VQSLAGLTQDPAALLVDWITYIRNSAKIITVEVTDEASAYTIFEVLNDRGLDLSVVDLLKNFVFRQAADRVSEAQQGWIEMTAAIESEGGDESVKAFIRHAWSARNGVTRERELYDKIKSQVTSKQAAIDLVADLRQKSVIYGALSNPGHELWKPFGSSVTQAVASLDLLGAKQIRPLLIALISSFDQNEVRRTMPMLVSWTVRFLICGSGGSGTLETQYAERAKEITAGTVTTVNALWKAMEPFVPKDDVFADSFATATVSKHYLARFYLRALEVQKRNALGTELVVNPDEQQVSLEHIMPQAREPHWTGISSDVHASYVKRIGNLTLLDKGLNSDAGNIPFIDKVAIFARSNIAISKELAGMTTWDAAAIDQRQKDLAALAVAAWNPKPVG